MPYIRSSATARRQVLLLCAARWRQTWPTCAIQSEQCGVHVTFVGRLRRSRLLLEHHRARCSTPLPRSPALANAFNRAAPAGLLRLPTLASRTRLRRPLGCPPAPDPTTTPTPTPTPNVLWWRPLRFMRALSTLPGGSVVALAWGECLNGSQCTGE